MRAVLLAGAEKVSVNSAAVLNPRIIAEGAEVFGRQCVVLGMDVKKVAPSAMIPSGYEVVIDGGRTRMGRDALEWAKEAEGLGAGEIYLNSIDADGTQEGYEMTLTSLISEERGIPVMRPPGGGEYRPHLRTSSQGGTPSPPLSSSSSISGLTASDRSRRNWNRARGEGEDGVVTVKSRSLLVLEDGTAFEGRTFAGEGEVEGEVVFNTSMTGYQEILTDPSYHGQIVVMTYPLVGNYGINPEDMESANIQVEGFVVREYEPAPSNWRSRMALAEFLGGEGSWGLKGWTRGRSRGAFGWRGP